MTLTEEEAALLDDNSDDCYGLWEVDWWFNSAHPERPHASRAELVASLVRRGLIEVFFGRLGLESPRLIEEAALKALSEPNHWEPRSTPDEAVYHISTSPEGIRALASVRTP